MKYLILLFLIGNTYINAQTIDGGYMKSCANLESIEAKVACTDSILLEELKVGWSEIKNEIEPGVYSVDYSISSNGNKKAVQIILIPQRVVLNSKPELLLELVDKSLQKYEWIYPEEDTIGIKNVKLRVEIQRPLLIDTKLL